KGCSPAAQMQEPQPRRWRVSEAQRDGDPAHVFESQPLRIIGDQLGGLDPVDQQQPGPGCKRVGPDFCGARIDLIDTGFNIDCGPRLVTASVAHLRTIACFGTPCHGASVRSTGSPSGSNPAVRRVVPTSGVLHASQASAYRSPTTC